MRPERFEALTRALAIHQPRRRTLGGIVAAFVPPADPTRPPTGSLIAAAGHRSWNEAAGHGGCPDGCDPANPHEVCFAGECCLQAGASCAATTTATPCCLADLPLPPIRCGNAAGEAICCLAAGQTCSHDDDCGGGSCPSGLGPGRRCAPEPATPAAGRYE